MSQPRPSKTQKRDNREKYSKSYKAHGRNESNGTKSLDKIYVWAIYFTAKDGQMINTIQTKSRN